MNDIMNIAGSTSEGTGGRRSCDSGTDCRFDFVSASGKATLKLEIVTSKVETLAK